MYLESFKIENYRKFRTTNNVVRFVEPKTIESDTEASVLGPSTTLIIGKNNAGKTTIANALKLVCDNMQPKASDFNIYYLNELYDKYKAGQITKSNLPELRFQLTAIVESEKDDSTVNLDEFMPLKNKGEQVRKVSINIRVKISEEEVYLDSINNLFESGQVTFESFYELLNQNSKFLLLEPNKKLFKIKFYDENNYEIPNFSLKNLINLREIRANRHLKEGVLKEIFNKIIKFQFDSDDNEKESLENNIIKINDELTKSIRTKNDNVSDVLKEIEDEDHVDLDLQGNVTYDSIVKDLIKYSFSDDGQYIPEGQFGLGYINLLNIIGEVIHYVDSYKLGSSNDVINLLFIEEPEAFMHPQMQEFFINRIDNAVKKALEIANSTAKEGERKVLNCQVAVTTHSSHIVNSKIHSSNTFNNINYLTVVKKSAQVINLNDDVVSGGDIEGHNLKFIKKHIKYKVSELFFSDAVVFVEGMTEETLLQHFLSTHTELNKYYISVFNINGAHGKVYLPLAKALKIPCLLITDIDIKREKCQRYKLHRKDDDDCLVCGHEKGKTDTVDIKDKREYTQIKTLDGMKTTNPTIWRFNVDVKKIAEEEKEYLGKIDYMQEDDNIFLVFQKDNINGYQATSLEEAFILTNYNNDILNNVLKKCKERVYKSVLNRTEEDQTSNLLHHSYELQKKLSQSKSDFASELLFECVTNEHQTPPDLPVYIKDGFDWLKSKLISPKKIAEEV